MQCFYNTIIGNVTDTDTETVAVERYEVHIMRTSGILLPVASLPSKYGIGAFRKKHTSLWIHLRRQVRATGRSFR